GCAAGSSLHRTIGWGTARSSQQPRLVDEQHDEGERDEEDAEANRRSPAVPGQGFLGVFPLVGLAARAALFGRRHDQSSIVGGHAVRAAAVLAELRLIASGLRA